MNGRSDYRVFHSRWVVKVMKVIITWQQSYQRKGMGLLNRVNAEGGSQFSSDDIKVIALEKRTGRI
jgi:hypothetical protein